MIDSRGWRSFMLVNLLSSCNGSKFSSSSMMQTSVWATLPTDEKRYGIPDDNDGIVIIVFEASQQFGGEVVNSLVEQLFRLLICRRHSDSLVIKPNIDGSVGSGKSLRTRLSLRENSDVMCV